MKAQIESSPSFAISSDREQLREILQTNVSIAIWKRPVIPDIQQWIRQFIASDFQKSTFNTSIRNFKQDFEQALGDYQALHPVGFEMLSEDVGGLLAQFSAITQKTNFRIFWAIVDNGMCRRFHTDVNVLRLLCTYEGPGTQWVKPENINHDLSHSKGNEMIINPDEIQQARPFDVVILKGALHEHKTTLVLHRSPPLEQAGEKRVLFRIDLAED